MSNEVAQLLSRSARRLVALPVPEADCTVIYSVKRVKVEELRRAGFVAMVGQYVLASAQDAPDIDILVQREQDKLGPEATPEELAEAEAAVIRKEAEDANRRAIKSLKDPSAQVEWLNQCDAYIMATVEAAGIANADYDGTIGPLATDLDPTVACAQFDDGKYLRRLQFVDDDTQTADHQVAIGSLTPDQRLALGLSIMKALLDPAEVRPFRRAARFGA